MVLKVILVFVMVIATLALSFFLIAIYYVRIHGDDADRELLKRIRYYFDISRQQEINIPSIREAILKGLPIGSSLERTRVFLNERSVGKDGLSLCYFIDKKNVILCQIECNEKLFGVVKGTYVIKFSFGYDKKLEDVKIEERATGP